MASPSAAQEDWRDSVMRSISVELTSSSDGGREGEREREREIERGREREGKRERERE